MAANFKINAKNFRLRRFLSGRKRPANTEQPCSETSSLFSTKRSSAKRKRQDSSELDDSDSDSANSLSDNISREESDLEMEGTSSNQELSHYRVGPTISQPPSNYILNWAYYRSALRMIGQRRRSLSSTLQRARLIKRRRRIRLWARLGNHRSLAPNPTPATDTIGTASSRIGVLSYFENSQTANPLGQLGSQGSSHDTGRSLSIFPNWLQNSRPMSLFSGSVTSNRFSSIFSSVSATASATQTTNVYDMSSLAEELGALENNSSRRKRPKREPNSSLQENAPSACNFASSSGNFSSGLIQNSEFIRDPDDEMRDGSDEELYERSNSGCHHYSSKIEGSSHSLKISLANTLSPQQSAAVAEGSLHFLRLFEKSFDCKCSAEGNTTSLQGSFPFRADYNHRFEGSGISEMEYRCKNLPEKKPASMKGKKRETSRFNSGPSALSAIGTHESNSFAANSLSGATMDVNSEDQSVPLDPDSPNQGDDMVIETLSNLASPCVQGLGETFWNALLLEKNPLFERFWEEFSHMNSFSLFRTARIQFISHFTFHELLVELANHGYQKSEISPKLRSRVVFDDNILIIGEKNFFTTLMENTGSPEAPGRSILKVKDYQYQLEYFSHKEFRHTDSEKKTISLERKMRAKVINCQQYLLEYRLDPESVEHDVAILAFRQCFNFSRRHFARVANQKILDYISQLSDTRKNIDSLLFVFVGHEYEYATILDFFCNSITAQLLDEVEDKLALLELSLEIASALLDGLRITLLHMREGFLKYVTGMAELVQTTIINRMQCEEFFEEYCLLQTKSPLEALALRKSTNFDKLIKELDILVKHNNLLNVSGFEEAFQEIQTRFDVVSKVRYDLQFHVKEIKLGVSDLQFRFGADVPHDGTVEVDMIHLSDAVDIESEDVLMESDSYYTPVF